jgi:hypothetical protein
MSRKTLDRKQRPARSTSQHCGGEIHQLELEPTVTVPEPDILHLCASGIAIVYTTR